MADATVEAQGHLIDSGDLQGILTTIVEHGAAYEIQRFDVGRTNADASRLTITVRAEHRASLEHLLVKLSPYGCYVENDLSDVLVRAADIDGAAPIDFYSTTNHRTEVRLGGAWQPVDGQRMDATIVITERRATCRKLRDIRAGDQIVCGMHGVRVMPDVQSRDRPTFGFMSNEVSSERRVETAVARVADLMRRTRAANGRIAFVAGPVVIHTGGGDYFCELIRLGYVDLLCSGNALAVHDIEFALSGTSLGIDLGSGHPVEHGHRNHMRAINEIRRAGGIANAVATGVLSSGVMHACHLHNVRYLLAGSIRDDGPLPETMMDLVEAQDAYAQALAGVDMVIMLSSMLHSIGVGNLLPSWVKVVCVDINPAVVTKLSDRGSTQTIGIVTDVGLFLHQLAESLRIKEHATETSRHRE
ncbi:MAG TPA: TIGR00300 family protein [Vicinamibacterales bacterium]|nr:TIGR00300 family protein [Vicinamibacterales bacterium]